MTHFDDSCGSWIAAIDAGGSKIAGAITQQSPKSTHFPQQPATIRHTIHGTGSAAVLTWSVARNNLIRMFESLLNQASARPENISKVVLMLAGAGRPDDVARVTESLTKDSPFGSCRRLTITSDIQPLLYAACDSQSGMPAIVAIAGTGSLVAALDAEAQVVRAGGWGPLLGDEGSGWGLAQAFLKSFCTWIDSGSKNVPEGLQVLRSFLADQPQLNEPQKLNSAIIALASDRHRAAQLAPAIIELASKPNANSTLEIVNQQIALLADQIQQVHRRLAMANRHWRLCLAGGLASNDRQFQHFLSAELTRRAITPASVSVLDPLVAALRFAAKAE